VVPLQGNEAELQVFEALSHAQYIHDAAAPETREAMQEIAVFFNRYLTR
jgi:monoterpene epsilon-lactone hydrolase